MADYLAMARTNYFMVIDEERYQELFQHLVTNGKVEDFTKEQDGVLYHGFGAYGSIDYQVDLKSEESEFDFDYFTNELQKILPVDEAFIYQETGHEKLRYLEGCAIVVTSKEVRGQHLSTWVKDTVKELLGENNKVTECSY